MKLSVVGTGYVGLVAAACFAESGNHVTCVDNDESKIRSLKEGRVPIYEPGLAEIVLRNKNANRLTFTTDLVEAVKQSRIIFIAVGTPQASDGSADLSAILDVARTIGTHMDGYRIIVMKSTVPVGTHQRIAEAIASKTDHPFDCVSNPEFLKEGAAIDDFMKPDRVIIGATNHAVILVMKELYGAFMRRSERIMVMDPASAEMTKYAANAMLASRISLMNEIACLCDRFGADVEMVRQGIGSDSRIGTAFLFPGVGYGGSCFPKDVSALVAMGDRVSFPMEIVKAVQDVNQRQREMFAQKIIDHFGDDGRKSTLAVWGLAFKARTDDIRESPAIAAIQMFLSRGFTIRAHDPAAMSEATKTLGDSVEMFEDGYEALTGADALVIFTDWSKFRTPDFDMIAERMPSKIIFDGRNMYDPELLSKRGFSYSSVGRPMIGPA